MKKWLIYPILMLVCGAIIMAPRSTQAQTANRTVYVDPTSPFSDDFTAAVMKKNVPVTVTVNPVNADYTATFSVAKRRGSIFRGVTSELTTGFYKSGAWDQATIRIVDNHSKDVVFSYTCKKGNNMGDSMTTSVAECLAKHWKQHMKH